MLVEAGGPNVSEEEWVLQALQAANEGLEAPVDISWGPSPCAWQGGPPAAALGGPPSTSDEGPTGFTTGLNVGLVASSFRLSSSEKGPLLPTPPGRPLFCTPAWGARRRPLAGGPLKSISGALPVCSSDSGLFGSSQKTWGPLDDVPGIGGPLPAATEAPPRRQSTRSPSGPPVGGLLEPHMGPKTGPLGALGGPPPLRALGMHKGVNALAPKGPRLEGSGRPPQYSSSSEGPFLVGAPSPPGSDKQRRGESSCAANLTATQSSQGGPSTGGLSAEDPSAGGPSLASVEPLPRSFLDDLGGPFKVLPSGAPRGPRGQDWRLRRSF